MAWIEDEPWDLEQGIDGLKIFQLFEDEEQTEPWIFTGYDVNATVSDQNGKNIYTVTVATDPSIGEIRLILPEAIVNSLNTETVYRYDCLLVAPGAAIADDNVLATGPVTVSLRTTRRDP